MTDQMQTDHLQFSKCFILDHWTSLLAGDSQLKEVTWGAFSCSKWKKKCSYKCQPRKSRRENESFSDLLPSERTYIRTQAETTHTQVDARTMRNVAKMFFPKSVTHTHTYSQKEDKEEIIKNIITIFFIKLLFFFYCKIIKILIIKVEILSTIPLRHIHRNI